MKEGMEIGVIGSGESGQLSSGEGQSLEVRESSLAVRFYVSFRLFVVM